MRPKVQKKIEFDNTCNCIVDLALLEKAIIWYSEGTLKGKRKIYMHGEYAAVSVFNKKIHVHRLLMLFNSRGDICSNIHVHHKDENKLNCLVRNLELKQAGAHVREHLKGRTLTKEHRKKISEANKKRKGIKMKKRVQIDLDILKKDLESGLSINAIAIKNKCSWDTIKLRIYENPNLCKQE